MLNAGQVGVLKYCYLIHGLDVIPSELMEQRYTKDFIYLSSSEIWDMTQKGYLWADSKRYVSAYEYRVTQKFVDEYMKEE